ncbi:tetratricopeptide repeat-containing sensor histidine kinase [Aquimarina algicola]|uniref:Tetratricopeptide repeat protein n=1 Tax=Aquimarina algicola TaxID=2589995 RepID=A0A504JLR2_9FLAO|nr:tetratricopeptide repeat protein [Aquimarina algicola]TPN88728.1 tetratricopeptide repeat protein [Aquimarina algicola]
MKILVYILFTGVFLITFSIQAQTSFDKLKEIEYNIVKSKEFMYKNVDSSLFYIEKALSLSQSIQNDTLIAKSNLQKSSVLITKGGFLKADSILQKNLSKALPKHLEGQTWHNLGTIQYYKQDFKKALSIYLKAAKILEETKNSKQLVGTYTNIGSINASLRNFENAQKYLERALPLSDFNENIRLQILVNLCTIYYEQKLFKKYLSSVKEAENLAKKYKSKSSLSVIYSNLSNYYSTYDIDYQASISYGKKALQLKKELNSVKSLNITYNNIGNAYLKNKEYKKAIQYLDSAMPGSKGVLRSYIYNNLKDSYVGLNDYKKAIYYADLKDKLKDSITETKQKEKVAELTEKYESEKKQQRIDILDAKNEIQALTISQQKYVLIAISVFIVLFAILGYFGFNNYKTKQQLDTLLLEQRLRKIQLNPHFLFNALQSIQNFIYQNDKEKSGSYLASYSKLIRLILEKSDDDFITVADDKLALQSYLDLQQLNLNNAFSYTIDSTEDIEEDFDTLPSLITQPFVENAVLHGLKNNTDGKINIEYYKENTTLFVSIVDNGKGYQNKKEDEKRLHKSMSMNIINEQLKNLNRTLKNFDGNIAVESSETGTKVILSFTTL